MGRFFRASFWLTLTLVLLITTLAGARLSPTSAQPNPETWMDLNKDPDVSYGDVYAAKDYLDNHRVIQSVIGNRTTTSKTFPILGSAGYTQEWYETNVGHIGRGGQGFVPAGKQDAGFMDKFGSLVFPTMNDSVLLEVSEDGTNRASLRHGPALDATLIKDPEGNMPNFWSWDNPASLELNYQDGTPYNLDDSTIYSQTTYSDNAQWMIIWDQRGYIIRVDLINLSLASYRVASGKDAGYAAAAISDDGRYIATYVYGEGLYILDTAGCTVDSSYIIVPLDTPSCKIKDLRDYAREYLDVRRELSLYFYNKNILGVRGLNSEANDADELIFRAPNTTTRHYVALGDSYSSGEGAGSYIGGTDIKRQNMCHTSKKSYPYILKDKANVSSFLSVACSGAKIENYWSWAQQPNTPAWRGTDFPGASPQRKALKNADIVTITMSGNDIGFSDMLSYCLSEAVHCYNSYEARMEIANMIIELRPHLVDMYKDLLGYPPNRRRVYVIGYPQIMDTGDGDNCGNNTQFTRYQRNMANDLISFFNAVIKNAATEAGVLYVSMEGTFRNYKLCGGESHVAAVNGLTFGDETGLGDIGPFSKSSYHPTALGQRMMGQRILETTNNLSERMPRATQYTSIPDPHDYPFTKGVSSNKGIIHKIKYNIVTDNVVVQRGIPNLFKTTVSTVTWAPRTFVKVVLFSDPVMLGEFEVDDNGEFIATIILPDNVPTGMHELQINGFGHNGTPTSIRQFIYVKDETTALTYSLPHSLADPSHHETSSSAAIFPSSNAAESFTLDGNKNISTFAPDSAPESSAYYAGNNSIKIVAFFVLTLVTVLFVLFYILRVIN